MKSDEIELKLRRSWLNGRTLAVLIVGGLGGAIAVAALLLGRGRGVEETRLGPTYTAKKGTFEFRITESGTLQALDNVVITGQIAGGKAKIVRLAPDGAMVRAGDLLVEFDRSAMSDEIGQNRRELERVKMEKIRAEEEARTEQATIDQGLRRTEEAIRVAELELKNQQEAVGPLRVKRAEAELNKTRSEYEKRAADFHDFESLLKQDFVSQAELDRARIKMNEAKNALDFAQTEYDNFVKYGQPAEVAAGTAKVQAERDGLNKTKETAQFRLRSKEAAIRKAEADLESVRYRLAERERQMSGTRITAPISGFVIHATTESGGERRKIQIGDSVDYNQEVLSIPNTTRLVVESQIREVDIHKVKVGQEAAVRVDAYPDLVLNGKVQMIGTLAAGRGQSPDGDKFFSLKILLDSSDPRLRPGMTARLEIVADRLQGSLMIPIDAVFVKDGRKIVYRVAGETVEEREVKIDQANPDFFVVNAGLAEGDRVLLIDPNKKDRPAGR